MRTIYIFGILVLLAVVVSTSPAHAGGVVTVCDEAHLLAALAGGGTVTFACSGVIALTDEIVIAADTTIDGSGQEVTISGNDAVRVFNVNEGVTFIVSELTIANGHAAGSGGGIYNNGGLLIMGKSAVSGNSATGFASVGGGIVNSNSGGMVVRNSTFSGNRAGGGGAIYNGYNGGGTLVISHSAFSANSAGYGGGIYSVGVRVSVSDSRFSDNSAASAGGAIFNSNNGALAVGNSTFAGNSASAYGGGGIVNDGGALTASNSTFVGNSAYSYGGGIHNDWGTLTLSNCTFSGNSAGQGGGFANDSGNTTILMNTMVVHSPTGGNCSGAIVDGGGNLSYPDTTCPGINADPVLGPLQDNGGPTWTMALGPGSAAIDAANDTTCAADLVNNRDQRGVVRPQGVHCDIGAFERPIKWLPIMLVQ